MFYIDETNRKQHCYVTYGRQFLRYKWYKPLITGLLFLIFYVLFAVAAALGVGYFGGAVTGQTIMQILSNAGTTYDDLNVNNFFESVLNLGQVALMIPALFVARLIVRDRPFSSYSSSRGGWHSGLFFRYLGICVITVVIPLLIHEYFTEGFKPLDIKFTLAGFLAVLILGPIQCIAEEYVFRGLLMQTLGSWIRIPVIAVILQAVLFAASHPYNWTGKCAILASGLGFGMAAWIGRGIELSSAIHVANNMTAFILMGLGQEHIQTEVSRENMIFDICMYSANVIVLFILSRKTDWFNKGRKDDLTIANDKETARRARKAGKKAGKKGASYGTEDKVIDFTAPEPVVSKAQPAPTAPEKVEAAEKPAVATAAENAKAAEIIEITDSAIDAYSTSADAPEHVGRTGGRVARNKDKY